MRTRLFFSRPLQTKDRSLSLWGIILCWAVVLGLLLFTFPRSQNKASSPLSYRVSEGVYRDTLSGSALLCYSALPISAGEGFLYTPYEGQKVAKGEAVLFSYPLSARSAAADIKRHEEALHTLSLMPYVNEAVIAAFTAEWRQFAREELTPSREARLLALLSAYQGKPDRSEAQLQEELALLQSGMPTPLHITYAEQEGYLLTKTDGYEDIWDTGDCLSLSADRVLSLLTVPPASPPKAKLLCDFQAHVLLMLSPDRIGRLIPEKVYTLWLEDGTTLSCTLKKTDISSDGSTGIAILNTALSPAKQLPTRQQNATLVSDEQVLLRVPKNAVGYIENQAYALINKGGRALARGIKPLYETEAFLWFSPVSGTFLFSEEKCPYLKRNELVLLDIERYRHREILT